MSQMGLSAYMYAPKDDVKHRQMWRDKYTDHEAGTLFKVDEGVRSLVYMSVCRLGAGDVGIISCTVSVLVLISYGDARSF